MDLIDYLVGFGRNGDRPLGMMSYSLLFQRVQSGISVALASC